MLGNDFFESKVTIRKDELLHAVRENRVKHVQEHAEAMAGYRLRVVDEARKLVEDGTTGKTIDRGPITSLVVPPNHAKDYDRVIRMLEMSTADVITVSETQFSNFVLDEWNWSAAFKNVTSGYTGKR